MTLSVALTIKAGGSTASSFDAPRAAGSSS